MLDIVMNYTSAVHFFWKRVKFAIKFFFMQILYLVTFIKMNTRDNIISHLLVTPIITARYMGLEDTIPSWENTKEKKIGCSKKTLQHAVHLIEDHKVSQSWIISSKPSWGRPKWINVRHAPERKHAQKKKLLIIVFISGFGSAPLHFLFGKSTMDHPMVPIQLFFPFFFFF